MELDDQKCSPDFLVGLQRKPQRPARGLHKPPTPKPEARGHPSIPAPGRHESAASPKPPQSQPAKT
eukprot:scaffold373723_cov29-Prasinocladus_malaysianus.AAC.1